MRYILFFSVFLFTSCVSQSKMLQLMNTGTKLPANSSNPNLFVNHVSTNVTSTSVQGIKQWPQVKQQKYTCIPLVFFTNWNSTYHCQIGYRDVEQNLKPNFEGVLKQKFSNSELFQRKIAFDTVDYTLEVSVDTIQSQIPFVSKGTFIFALVAYTYWFREGVEESDLSISTSYRFSKNGQIINSGSVTTKRKLGPEKNNMGSKKKYMQRYFTNYFGELNQMLHNNATEIVNRLETDFLSRQ